MTRILLFCNLALLCLLPFVHVTESYRETVVQKINHHHHEYACRANECVCDGLCTNHFAHWKSYNAYNWFSFLRKPWPLHPNPSLIQTLAHQRSEDQVICGMKWFESLKLRVGSPNPAGFGKPQITLVREWISAELNVWMGACETPRISELISSASTLLSTSCGDMVMSNTSLGISMEQLAATLRLYNTGSLGPGPCGCGDGILQEREDCDLGKGVNGADGSCCTEKCTLSPAGQVCRLSNGPCDLEEYCTGEDPVCPPDGFSGQETVCRPSAGLCDREERCSGDQADCPHDGLRRAGWTCRPAAAECDQEELCDGSNPECPPDEIHRVGHICRESMGECDLPESCDGISVECPQDQVKPASTICRTPSSNSQASLCDCSDVCDGESPMCPVHKPLSQYEYAVEINTVSDTFESGLTGSSGTLPWTERAWILYKRGAGQDVSIEGGNLNITYLSTAGISAHRALPPPQDPERLAGLVLKGKLVLSKASAQIRILISVTPQPCSELNPLANPVWCGIVRSASDERVTTEPFITINGRSVPCDGLNLARRLLFHAPVDPGPFQKMATNNSSNIAGNTEGCIAIWTGRADSPSSAVNIVTPTTILFNDLTLEMQTEAPVQYPRTCNEILIPDPGQTVLTSTCPQICPGDPGCYSLN